MQLAPKRTVKSESRLRRGAEVDVSIPLGWVSGGWMGIRFEGQMDEWGLEVEFWVGFFLAWSDGWWNRWIVL